MYSNNQTTVELACIVYSLMLQFHDENPPVQCDIYSKKWVSDDAYPIYPAGECPYMSGALDYKGNMHLDSGYTRWRWKPRDCNIPRYAKLRFYIYEFFEHYINEMPLKLALVLP